ncbi:hypothetical protein HDA32_002917 [Spinactinospora alkalitolerans]|uniref:Uncharacterized protein n=1 Tax=Spinactinospora alkalitolerans TaxID=687207 RepID=A0A852TWW3_9ACTN|nr:hypothetical protein [Spinactinospora alkalitolerans]
MAVYRSLLDQGVPASRIPPAGESADEAPGRCDGREITQAATIFPADRSPIRVTAIADDH